MNHSSLVTVHDIVSDLPYIADLVLPPHPRENIAQEGPKAQGCVSWLWYKHDQLLAAIVMCGGRAKSERILLIIKGEAGETKTIAVMTMFTENYSGQALMVSSRQGKQAQSPFSVILGFVLYELKAIRLSY